MTVWDKLDSGLTSVYLNYLRVREGGAEAVARVHSAVAGGGRLNVTMRYTGDLSAIEAIGFRTLWNHGQGRVGGTLDLSNLEQLAAHPGVLKLSFGTRPKPMLDKSVPQIRADQVWTFSSASKAFSGSTGAGVVVGIIDTGIDFQHPFFLKTSSPKTTRILRIWDQGLGKKPGENEPDPALLSVPASGNSYGVEYTDIAINKVLQKVAGATPVRHRDCDGHGTHVASIAAGNGEDKFKFIGVAPEANLVVVKHIYLENTPQVGGHDVDASQLFADAVSYILNVAKNVFGQPVVINYSLGSSMGPHDGFTEDEIWLSDKFAGSTGEAFVTVAGNDGGPQQSPDGRQHVRIDFPAAGDTVDIPLDLFDPRTNRREFGTCSWVNATESLRIQLYYPVGGPALSASLQFPPVAAIAGFKPCPALGAAPPPPIVFKNRHCTMTHSLDAQPLSGGAGTVNRNLLEITFEPFRNRHVVGRYVLRVTCPGALSVHVWCEQGSGGGFYGLEIRTAPALPPIVKTQDAHQINSSGGAKNVITTAAYNAEMGNLDIAEFSSRGPLVSYDPAFAQPNKPDLGAPGVDVDAAKSRDRKPAAPGITTQMQGTSMAAPHITGVVALMFEKNLTLDMQQILSTLQAQADPISPPETPDDLGAGRVDAKNTFDNTP